MTREEAIKQLETWRECMRVDFADPDVIETYNMAIQALSYDDTKYHEEHGEVVIADVVWEDALKALKAQQEPTGDLISRQAVLDAMYELCDTGENLKDNPWRDNPHFDAITDAINELPSAGKTGWIPVGERLPETWKEVLTTYQYNGKRYVQTAQYAGQTNERGEPLFCADSDEYAPKHYEFEYVAWMPLPDPYKAEEGKQDEADN